MTGLREVLETMVDRDTNRNRICAKCGVKSIVSSYTKKGLMVVMCPECGKVWRYNGINR
jgi:uncharacterized Zn finger protein